MNNLTKYLNDIRLSVGDVESYVKNVSNAFHIEKNQLLFDALCRRIAIIGEALYLADQIDPSMNISNKERIIEYRNITAQDYDAIQSKDLYKISMKILPPLKIEVLGILNTMAELR